MRTRYLAAVGTLSARAKADGAYRDYRIAVLAARSAAGIVDVQATLLGGPQRLVRRFAFRSEEHDARTACERVQAELRSVIDDLCLQPSARTIGGLAH